MSLRERLGLGLAAGAVLALGAWSVQTPAATRGPDIVTAGILSSVPRADGGCRHTIKVHNSGSRTVSILWADSHVRTRLGWWKQIYGGGYGLFYQYPDPAEYPVRSCHSDSWIYTTSFGCNANRKWRFHLRRSDGHEYMLYIPSSGFTTSTTVDLGDVGRSSLW